MVSFTNLLFAFVLPLSIARKFHEHMSEEDVMDVFQITSKSVIPDYKLMQIKHKIDKRTLSQVVEVEISNKKKTLFLNPTEGYLAGKHTKVWVTESEPFYSYDIKLKLIPNIMDEVGEFFHDLNNGAAIRVRRDARGHVLLDGMIDPNHMIRSIPERYRNNNTLIPRHILSSNMDENDFRITYHHVIYKIPNSITENYQGPFHPMPPISRLSRREANFESPNVVYPEILVVIDQAFFSKFNGNVKNAVSYILTFWNAVDLRYRVLDRPKVRLNIAGIILFKGPLTFSNAYWEKNGEGRYTMNLILPQIGSYFNQRWAFYNKASFDMVILTTGYDLLTEIDGVLRKDEGAAYLQGACNFTHNVAVGIFRDPGGFQGLTSGSHEVAHLLGAPHDNVFPDKDCEWNLGYMMSYVNGSERRVRLNRCSQEHIRDFLNSDKALCLQNLPPKDEPLPKLLPGKYFSLDAQCRHKTGYPACNYGPKNCVQLHCFEIKNNEKVCSAFEPAAEGSSCGSNKYCLNAECTDESSDIIPNLITY